LIDAVIVRRHDDPFRFGRGIQIPWVCIYILDRKEYIAQQEPADEQTDDKAANAEDKRIGKQIGAIVHCASERASGKMMALPHARGIGWEPMCGYATPLVRRQLLGLHITDEPAKKL
jgi:hypothetical protein